MQITNNKTTVELDQQRILDLITNRELNVIERVVKKYYGVKTIQQLTPEAIEIILYLAIIKMDKPRNYIIMCLIQEYNLTEAEIVAKCESIFKKAQTDKAFHNMVYSMHIAYNKRMKLKNLFKQSA